ncbi:sugar phosphate nucleotidyltransferase [Mycobacterium sp. URHD0025]|uniref:sugar phosphate nucleotidyltransferase n=1 Tax=Mycobacterium sp. URHD0025 TaxID=1298864 RepID=UPI00048D1502|nr:sugar phosphate nucleotidyltransferase [Mycobacterium sp. URHD0025]
MKVRRAVIAAAGLGTRMYPITKTIDKAMLPIGAHPAIDLIVSECQGAGVDQIAVVVRAGTSQVQDYYTPDPDLEALLARHSWQSKGEVLNDIGRGIDFQFFHQQLDVDDYGTAVPLLLVADFVGDEPFFYISGDDILIDNPTTSTLRNLADQVHVGGSGLVARACDRAEAGRYGVLDVVQRADRLHLSGLQEKEVPADPTRDPLVNISRYVLQPTIVDLVRAVPVDPLSGERRITDALLQLVDAEVPPLVYVTDGQYFDIGDHRGLLAANNFVASKDFP